ncbi:MAG: type I-E CRISPR-associated protein Cas7/Cse4/CasC [Actinomycetales bacterium]|nr:type I-E CRISPR-associated protein Cas7/Cse4/CasC [Actinomycetales bacterium]
MTDTNFLTIHSLTALPWHNLNRDDRGLPKQVREGGKTRGRLSAQSLKRAIRVAYEIESAEVGSGSLRSRDLPDEVLRRAIIIAKTGGLSLDEKAALKTATKIVRSLTANAAEPKEGDEDKEAGEGTVTWLSGEEIDSLATAIVEGGGNLAAKDFISSRTGSLAIAAFGRMFAAQNNLQTEAAIAVGPATTTHPITIEVDYFTTVDDLGDGGAGHLGQAFYTTGVYYRSVTIDKKQLRESWTGWESPDATERLNLMVRCLVTALPTGKDNSSAPNTKPALVIAEQQAHRTAYDFQEPVKASADGGYLETSIDRLLQQGAAARAFDASEFGDTFLSGTSVVAGESLVIPFESKTGDLGELVDSVVNWLKQ